MSAIPPQASELEAALRQAVMHHQAGRLPQAEDIYRRILQVQPDHPGTSNNLGIALRDQGKIDEALAVFRRVIAVAPDYAPAHSNLGNVLFAQGKLAEAEDSYRRALVIRPDMPDALKNLGLVIVNRGRFVESFPPFVAMPSSPLARRRALRATAPPPRRTSCGTTRSSGHM
jgi:tetratricopeptide (TPR) repeat protein